MATKAIMYVALAAIIGMIAYTVIGMFILKAYAQESEHAWVFVSNCDNYEYLHNTMPLQTSYVNYIGNYDVVCYPSANDPTQVQTYVALMRTVFPTDKLIFTFDTRNPATAYDFQLALSIIGVPASHENAKGVSFINDGWGMAVYNPEVADHELAHLVTGKANHASADIDNPSAWY